MTTPTARADAQFRKERREAKRAAQERHARDAVECARCGLTRSNVIHETDREHAPEGLAYYSDVPFCPFVSTMPWVRDDRSRGHPMTTPTARDVMLDEPTDSLIRRLVRAAWVTGKNGLWAGPINNGVIAKELIARADAADAAQQEVARLREALEEAVGEAHCPTTSGGTEGKWCLNHDTPMADAGMCEMVKGWLAALAPASPVAEVVER